MAFPPQFLDEIRVRIPLSGLIGRRMKLIKKGREFSGLCPFHNEKSPSFTVSEEKGFFHCFGCGAHGDAFGFVMRVDGLSFPEAVERLAQEAGLEVPRATPAERERERRRADLYDVMEKAASFYEAQLRVPAGRIALDYLRDRGLDDETISRFRLGFAPGGRGVLRDALMSDEMPEPMLVEAGLLGRPEDGGATYDRIRNRVMFPITDRRGRVIAFGGRILGDGQPKYLNSPDTPLFSKGQVLYGLATARRPAMDGGRVIVTEGYMDVIALARAGFPEAVAPLGTALTESQLHELWRLAPEPLLCFDGDSAGQRAAWRAAERALPLLEPGRSVRFVILPGGEDPDSLIAGRGAGAMAELLDAARPLDQVIWDLESSTQRIDTPERLAGLEKRLEDRAFAIADRKVQQQYLARFRQKLRDLSAPRRSGPWTARGPARGGAHGGPGVLRKRLHQVLLATIINHPVLLDDFVENLAGVNLSDPKLDKLREEILLICADQSALDSDRLKCQLEERGLAEPLSAVLRPEVYVHAGFAKPGATDEAARAGLEEAFVRNSEPLRRAELDENVKAYGRDETDQNWARFEQLKTQSQNNAEALVADTEDFRAENGAVDPGT